VDRQGLAMLERERREDQTDRLWSCRPLGAIAGAVTNSVLPVGS